VSILLRFSALHSLLMPPYSLEEVMNSRYLRLCLVTNLRAQSLESYQSFIIKAVKGGVTSIQLREKAADMDKLYEMVFLLKRTLKPFNIPIIINDYVNFAKAIDADGVHIGQSDVDPESARKILGPDKIIGLSIESLAELEKANQLSCIDYVAASAVWPSKTKPGCRTIWGLNGLKKFAQASRHEVIGIGGITKKNVQRLIEGGASGAAVIGAIHDADDPELAAKILINTIDEAISKREYHYVCKFR
jgi:thiamine-phosphate pyrophosphorylase